MPALNPIGIPFIELLSTDSTNNYAMGLVRAAMAQHGAVVFAREQTSGRGQLNKQWTSQKDQNIAMSILVEPKSLNTSNVFLLSKTVAVAVRQFFEKHAEDEIKIKWPNDIYWCDRKAAGILIENLWQGSEWKFAVAGIGININQTEFGVLGSKAVSLKQIAGKNFEPIILAKELCTYLEDKYQSAINKPSLIIEEYRSYLYKLNEKVKLKKGSRVFEATIKDVTLNGQLVVQHGTEEKFDVGEVEWMV